jgi:hypothetical protein
MQDINVLKKKVANSFVMKDLGAVKKILGMRITRDRKNHKLTCSGSCEQVMNNPGKEHWEAVKWILRYLRGTTTHALCFGGSYTFLHGYVDSDMAGDKYSRRITTGYVFTIGGTVVSWISKLQKVVALSTTEAEYVAATEASKEMIWLQRFMEELGKKQENNKLYCDS